EHAPEPAVRGPVHSQPQPAQVKPETVIQQPAAPGQERIIIRSRPEPQQYEAPPQPQSSPVQQPYIPPAPPVPSTPVSPAPEPPVVVVSRPAAPQMQEQAPVVVPPLGRDIKKPSSPIIVNPPAQQAAFVDKAQPSQEDTGAAILEDPRVIKLVDALVSGKLPDINPVVDFSYKMGYAYPSVSSLIDTSEVDTINILESLANAGILIRQPYEKFYIDPDGLFQLVPIERCPRCDSSNIVKGQLVEHFSCGYVGLDKDFKQDSRYVCPKCRKDLRLIGTDYRNVGIHYRCQDCSEVFTVPVVKWRNMKTRKIWSSEDLKEVEASSYQFSPDKKGWLEFQLKPKTQLVDFLKQRGYQVHELAQLTGRSGAVHTVDVLAIRDDIITKINLGIGILVAPSGEPEVGLESLFRFDTRAYDIGINYKVVIAIPKLGQEALNFAGRQMIRAFEAKTLATVVADITHLDRSNIGMQSRVEAAANHSGSVAANARGIIVRFLRNKGYEVYERALILGKSGIEHIFDIFARRDDKIVVPTIAIGIGNETGQQVGLDELSRFDAAAFDAGIRNKVFLGLSEISTQAKQFAMQQKIDIIEQQDLRKLT
ncbi:MAG: restriction endonuclease, partial [Dehalococcoidia bacterium]|nr:restriction endonuclease [Dehalococcoidia bacterium]